MPNSIERADRILDFFALQLAFAQQMATRSGIPLREAVIGYTNLHRRFGLGDHTKLGVSPLWEGYIARLEALPEGPERVAWTREFFLTAPDEPEPTDQTIFGCFACEAPTDKGIVRVHFINRDKDGVSPLDPAKIDLRRQELTRLVSFVAASYPTAETIMGTSWLYHVEAYRRLYPAVYVASAEPAKKLRMTGMSTWGQAMTHRETVRPAVRDAILANLDRLDVDAPWKSFPLTALVVSAPLGVFREFFGC